MCVYIFIYGVEDASYLGVPWINPLQGYNKNQNKSSTARRGECGRVSAMAMA